METEKAGSDPNTNLTACLSPERAGSAGPVILPGHSRLTCQLIPSTSLHLPAPLEPPPLLSQVGKQELEILESILCARCFIYSFSTPIL